VFTALAVGMVTDPSLPAPAGSSATDAVAATIAAAVAAARFLAVAKVPRWRLVATAHFQRAAGAGRGTGGDQHELALGSGLVIGQPRRVAVAVMTPKRYLMSANADEERHRAARAEQMALFCYQLIREAVDGGLFTLTRQRGRLVRELASRAHPGQFGEP
jgi:hypothetical protein